jgi:cellulose synthase/poly-beta-1,6-N-acetylglucosamine synthase-like glycosyltransferase
MQLLVIMLLIISTCYSVGLIIFWIGLFKKNHNRNEKQYTVSVIIAARNEEHYIHKLLDGIIRQTYPKELIEIIVVNDFSTDRTAAVVEKYIQKDHRIKLIHVSGNDQGLIGKKNALHKGIKNSVGELILTTDADCKVLPTWIETMVSYFYPDVGMVAGFSQLDRYQEKLPLFQKLQSIDFLALFSVGHGAINLGIPLSASGQNLAYRREVYEDVGGFSLISKRITGDDVALLQMVNKRTKWKICFASSKHAFNVSRPEQTMTGFLNQRKRWASDGSYQFKLNKVFFSYTVITYLVNLFLLFSVPLAIILGHSLLGIFVGTMIKFLSESLLLLKGCSIYERLDLLKYIPLWLILEIPYVVYVGLTGTIGSFKWKDRTVSMLRNL